MDPISAAALAAVLTKVLDATADEVGRGLWRSLTSIVRRVCRREATGEAVDRVDGAVAGGVAPDAAGLERLAAVLAAEARRDPTAARELGAWAERARLELVHDGSVHNVVHGEVRGNVVQAKDIHGDITFN